MENQEAKTNILTALDMAFSLGKQYWQQADSEYKSQWKRADMTLAKFRELKARMTPNTEYPPKLER